LKIRPSAFLNLYLVWTYKNRSPPPGLFCLFTPAMTSKVQWKQVGKNIIGYTEDSARVPSTADWVQNKFRDPKRRVSPNELLACFVGFIILPASRVCHQPISHLDLDIEIQFVFIT